MSEEQADCVSRLSNEQVSALNFGIHHQPKVEFSLLTAFERQVLVREIFTSSDDTRENEFLTLPAGSKVVLAHVEQDNLIEEINATRFYFQICIDGKEYEMSRLMRYTEALFGDNLTNLVNSMLECIAIDMSKKYTERDAYPAGWE